MWSNAGMANRQGDVDLRFAQVSTPVNTLAGWLAGWHDGELSLVWSCEWRLGLQREKDRVERECCCAAWQRTGWRKESYNVGVPTIIITIAHTQNCSFLLISF